MKILRRPIAIVAVAASVFAGPAVFASTLVVLESDTDMATAGYYQLRWESADAATRLVESTDPAFVDARVIYAGPDTARLVSGKPNGTYYYRLESDDRAAGAPVAVVSKTLKVTVEHHSMTRAFTFFATGAVVFAATLGLILLGGRRERS